MPAFEVGTIQRAAAINTSLRTLMAVGVFVELMILFGSNGGKTERTVAQTKCCTHALYTNISWHARALGHSNVHIYPRRRGIDRVAMPFHPVRSSSSSSNRQQQSSINRKKNATLHLCCTSRTQKHDAHATQTYKYKLKHKHKAQAFRVHRNHTIYVHAYSKTHRGTRTAPVKRAYD